MNLVKKKKRKLRLRSFLLLALFSLLLLVVIVGGIVYSRYDSSLKSVDFNQDSVIFEIHNGATLNSVLNDLKEADLISNVFFAKIYAKQKGLHDLKAGVYELTNGMDLHAILEYFEGNNAIIDQVYVTMPEGTWAMNMAQLIADKTSVTKDELINLWNDKAFVDEMIEKYFFLSKDVYHEEVHILLEGFLFPETYAFFADTTPRDITIKILDHTNEIYLEYQEAFEESEFSIFELITLASLVQFEANNEKDMKLVAGIFFKRMEIGMPLQASASVCYALYDKYKTQRDCEYNIDYVSKYNTYIVPKLPIGPMSNPGREAIEAVLYPTNSEYLYFVSDSSRLNHYAKTYNEHLINIDKYLK